MSARIRVCKEQNLDLISTSDPDLAVELCHVQTLKLSSRSYEVSTFVASTANSCKRVITGALRIPTEDALMNNTITYPQTRQRRSGPCVQRGERQLLEKTNDPPLRQLSEQLPPNNQPRSSPQHASSEGHGKSARSERSKTPKHGNETSQPIQPQAAPPIQTSVHSFKNYQPTSSQRSAKSHNTWPALPQREPTHAPGLEAKAAASSSSGLAAGGRLDQTPQSQLQRRLDPLADPGESPVEQASQNASKSTPPHSPALVQQTCA
ncbi:hypothetical protein HPB51_012586 [Rhipicephalus microplus]|uniref:Uncharacterized protein n=1 Tax=Rhipicephalus microplus TaxID=6941 RepID=A0A9J6DGG8_RHIMP|nr:hypothetical protein HPB51_012586 [Rhipicephalus microplus]